MLYCILNTDVWYSYIYECQVTTIMLFDLFLFELLYHVAYWPSYEFKRDKLWTPVISYNLEKNITLVR